jgi:hypothetical protein
VAQNTQDRRAPERLLRSFFVVGMVARRFAEVTAPAPNRPEYVLAARECTARSGRHGWPSGSSWPAPVLKKQGVVVDESMAKRLIAWFPFLTKEQVQLYQPMLLPTELASFGSLMIAIGAAGGRKPTVAQEIETRVGPREHRPAKAGCHRSSCAKARAQT